MCTRFLPLFILNVYVVNNLEVYKEWEDQFVILEETDETYFWTMVLTNLPRHTDYSRTNHLGYHH